MAPRVKLWAVAVALNAGVVLLFLVHLTPHLQVLFEDLFSDQDYLIDPDPDPPESFESDDDFTPVESAGSHILQTEAEIDHSGCSTLLQRRCSIPNSLL
eukprot:g7393.t1